MFLRVRVLLLDVSSSSHNWSATTPHGPERREHRSPFHPHRPWDIPARTTLRHERRVDVSYQVEQPTQSDPSLRRVAPASQNPLIHCYGCEDILFGRLNDLDAHWLAFWFEREVHVVPRQTVLGFIPRADVIGPTRCEHEEHFIAFGVWQFLQLWSPVAVIPGIFLQN
jgi:hypothetical protein